MRTEDDNINTFKFFVWLVIIAVLIGVLVGCNTVRIDERVVYGDTNTSVNYAPVRQWTDEGYVGETITNSNGEWSMIVPVDTVINLCIYDPIGNYEACYEDDGLLTPTAESGSHEMIRI